MGSWAASAAYLTGIGWFFATCIVLGVLAGRWADSATGLEPVFTLVGILIGLAAALAGGFRMLMTFINRFGNGTETP
ncbi:MAG: AtpZ/AtpI family protein [Dehalococcoidia bacterium]